MANARHPSWPLSMTCTTLLALISISATSIAVLAQSISTSTQVPPLQWINLTNLLHGSPPPPLKDASIGYDNSTRTLIIFGGESQSHTAQGQTYLLNLDTLTWAPPSPAPGLPKISPPARSAALSAVDVAANYRDGFVVFGGLGANGQPMNDVWEFDFQFQFWTQVTVLEGDAPDARWGAAGGNNYQIPTTQDPRLTGPNNTFFVAGGFDSKGAISLSDAWQFDIGGTLSSNLPNNVSGRWQKLSLHNTSLPATGGSATTVVFEDPQQFVVAVGGCSAFSSSDASCTESSSLVIQVGNQPENQFSTCPAPRLGGTLVTNFNSASSGFASQVFLLLGTFNSSVWQDGQGLDQGEVAILSIDTGAWARIIPAGDPATGQPSVPTPREGAAAVSYQQALVGQSRTHAADTIVFGGRDASGNYLDEVWLLRAYIGTVSGSGQQWEGFGDGTLQTGVDANGEGVTVKYLSQCATQIGAPPPPSGSSNQPTATGGGQPPPASNQGQSKGFHPYDTSTIHKVLAPLSIALMLPALVLYRLSLPSMKSNPFTNSRIGWTYLSAVIAVVAFALGLGGLATAFISLKELSPSLTKRASSGQNLATAHGKAGIALFAGFYGLLPLVLLIALLSKWKRHEAAPRPSIHTRTSSNDMAEKVGLYSGRSTSPFPQLATTELPAHEPQTRVQSGDSLGPWSAAGHTSLGRRSSESVSMDERNSPSKRSFEVTNRPQRGRHASAHSLAAFSDPKSSVSPRNMGDPRWFATRNSFTRNEYDHQSRAGIEPSTPGTAVMGMTTPRNIDRSPRPPTLVVGLIHFLLHAFLLALCVLSLIALWDRAPIAPFVVFLVWTVCFYTLLIALAWNGIPQVSVLTVIITRLRATPRPPPPPTVVSDFDGASFPPGHPYQHQPLYRPAHDSEYPTSISHADHTAEEYEDDLDDEVGQRIIEEELSRREVNIVTVPRRKLVVMNVHPESS